MSGYPLLAQRLYNTPLLIEPGKAQVIESVFRAHAEGRQVELPPFEAKPHVAPTKMERADAGYLIADGGVGILQIHGTLVQRASGLDAASGLTGYNRLQAQLQAMLTDPKVRGILLEIDSPGGEAAGVFDLAAQIMNAGKPIAAHANEMAFSAAYALASAAQDGLNIPESGMVGSVGVVLMHVDQSQKDAKQGLVYTPIYAGAKKVDYSSHAPLSDRARAAAQESVDHLYEIFVDHVAKARAIGSDVVKQTEAGLLRPGQAIDIGMADGVATFAEAVKQMQDRVSAPGFNGYSTTRHAIAITPKGTTMSKQDDNAPANTAATAEQIATARAEGVKEGIAQATAELTPRIAAATATGATAERARIKAITQSDAAKDRPIAAQQFAMETDMSAEAAIAMIGKLPKEQVAAPANPLAAAMAGVPNPRVGAGTDPAGDAPVAPPSAANVYAMRRKASGHAPQ